MKMLRFLFVIPLLALGLRAQSEPLTLTQGLVDQLLAEARGSNPSLRAAETRIDAAISAVDSVRTWEDPTVSFGLWTGSARGFEASQQGDLVYGIDQKLPIFNRPKLVRRVAESDAARDRFAADYDTERLRRDLTVALDDLALADREADVAGKNLRWLDATLATVDHRYRVGRASQVDWLKVQTARALAANDLTTQLFEREHSEVALNTLLNRPLHDPWPKMEAPKTQPALAYTSQLVELALSAEPKLKVLRQETDSAAAMTDLVRRQRLPNLSVGVQARQYSGDGGLREGMVTMSLSVPWLNGRRYDADSLRNRELERAKAFDADDYALSVREKLHHLIVDLDAARRQALLYRDTVIPLTEQTLRSAQSAWENNLGGFQDVLDARRMLLENDLSYSRAVHAQIAALADIALSTGIRDSTHLFQITPSP